MKKVVFFILLVFSLSLWGFNLSHTSISTFNIGNQIPLTLTIPAKVKVVLIFYKIGDEVDQYQVRMMKKDKNGNYIYTLDSRLFTARKLSYHFVYLKDGEYFRYPQTSDYIAIGKGELIKLPVTQKQSQPFPISISGNFQEQWLISTNDDNSKGEKPTKNGNLSLNGNFSSGNSQISFSSTGDYTPTQTKQYNVSSVLFKYKSGKHDLEVGDLSFQAPDLALSAYGKRGLLYSFSSNRFGINIFSLSSQQIEGLGLPKKNSLISGGMFNYKIGGFNFYTLYLSGKDDPTVGQNSSSSFTSVREGSVYSFGFNSSLFNYSLNLKAAYFSSNYTKDVLSNQKKKDHAIDTSASLNYKGLSLSSTYREIGAYYDTVGSSYMSNNQRNANASFSYNFSKITFSANYSHMESNIADLETIPKSKTNNFNSSLQFNFGKFSVGIGYTANKQETEVSDESSGLSSNMDTSNFTLNLAINPSYHFSWTLSGGKSLDRSLDEKTSYSFNSTINLSIGSFFSFSPSFTYLKEDKKGEIYETITSYLSYSLTLIPNAFSLSGTASYNDNKTPGGTTDSKMISASSRLSLSFGWLWNRLSQTSAYLEASYNKSEYSTLTTEYYKIYGSIIISF